MRLIDADALMKALGITDTDCGKCKWGSRGWCTRSSDFEDVCCAIEDAPTIDAKPVKHGYWKGKPIAGYSDVRCSKCGNVFMDNTGKWKYCPNCGAKMDKVRDGKIDRCRRDKTPKRIF